MISGYIILQSNLNLIQAWPQNQRSLETLPGSVWESSCHMKDSYSFETGQNFPFYIQINFMAYPTHECDQLVYVGHIISPICHYEGIDT